MTLGTMDYYKKLFTIRTSVKKKKRKYRSIDDPWLLPETPQPEAITIKPIERYYYNAIYGGLETKKPEPVILNISEKLRKIMLDAICKQEENEI